MGACSEELLSRLFCLCASTGDIKHNSSSSDDKVKATIFSSKGAAFATLFSLSTTGSGSVGTGFLIHRNLLLSTHSNLPSATVAESAIVQIGFGRVSARLVPQRFFITSSILDLTIVGLEQVDSDSTQPQLHFLKITCKPILNHNNTVYLVGHTSQTHNSSASTNLAVGTGKVIISTDDLIKIAATGATLPPGSAGFDSHGNLAFMLCDPMKLTSKEECESDPLQFGIPLAVICNWLYQHWEGSLDEVTKPRLGLGHSCTSFSLSNMHVFRLAGAENEGIPPPGRSKYWNFSSSIVNENPILDFRLSTQEQGVATPEIYESPGPSCSANRNQEAVFPKTIFLPLPLKQLFSEEISKVCGSSYVETNNMCHSVSSGESSCGEAEWQGENMTSEEETMYSAETMESRNISCSKKSSVPVQKVGRSHSCVTYHRWSSPGTGNSGGTRGFLRKQQSSLPVRNISPQNTAFRTSQDYLCPTVSSSLKRRNSADEMIRHKQSSVRVSPRWAF
ncbi:hypothetical protein FCM35_KLT17798 [Carex littledalei]|uniref:Uncharacterized protein n=1 Tax=Carex littledalei TaxID=544730 RepID=A0A833VFY8_9POAL|nr:hypothetical protein FCM35_KLT17798 [Carex littledalei]